MPNVIFPAGNIQHRSTCGNSYAYALPAEVQAGVRYVLERVAEDADPILATTAEEVLLTSEPDEKYSNSIVIQVGPCRFVLYAANGVFRIGAGGAVSSHKLAEEYKQDITAYFAEAL